MHSSAVAAHTARCCDSVQGGRAIETPVSFDDGAHGPHEQPESARRACDVLLEGNHFFVSLGEGPDARTAKWRLV